MANSAQNQLSAELSGIFEKTSAAPSVFKRIHAYRDRGTNADEFLMLLKYLLLPISAVFTLGFGIALHYHLTLPYLGNIGAGLFSLMFTLFIEGAKIVLGIWLIRNILFGMYKKGVNETAMMFCGALIAIGAFGWSYYNSTTGTQYITQYISTFKVERAVVDMNAVTADVDQRQAALAQTANEGLKSKWRGNTTVHGLRIAKNSTAAMIEQEKQRTILMEQAAATQQQTDAHRDQFIDKVSNLFALLGGKMEWFQVFIIFGMVFCEKSLWLRMQQGGNNQAAEMSSIAAKSNTIYFNRSQNGQVQAYPTPVNGLPTDTPPDTGKK